MDEPAPDRTADTGQAPSSDVLTAREAAARIGVNERTIRRAIARGELDATKRAGVFQIALGDLEQYQSDLSRAGGHDASGRRAIGDRGPLLVGATKRPPAVAIGAPPPHVRLLPLADRQHGLVADLPRPLTSLVGREREVSEVRQLLRRDDVRLVTLTGSGGIGKTRLAIQVATESQREFADGVAFVPLFAVSDPALVVPTIAHALAVRGPDAGSVSENLKLALRARQLLLVLDNVEHLLAAAPVLVDLLSAAPDLAVLVTSRTRLRLSGEHDYPVPPLTLPDPTRDPSPAELAASEAVRLFVVRAQSVRPDFALGDDNIPVVAAICDRLDRVPLAIELAAARSNLLPPRAILVRLERRLTLLTSGARDQPARLRSMRDAIAWSYELLTSTEQVLFRRLAIFAGGCTFDAAEAIGGNHELDAFELLASLVEKSLVLGAAQAENEPRFGMLETIREYGLEQLDASGEAETIRRRHAAYLVALAELADAGMTGPDKGLWLDRLEAEIDNFRAALAWALSRGDAETALTLSALLAEVWLTRGHLAEGRNWLERALVCGGDATTATRARALRWAGIVGWAQGDHDWATECLEQGLALYRRLDDRPGIVRTLIGLGNVAGAQGDDDRQLALLEETLPLARASGDTHSLLVIYNNLGNHAERRRDLDNAVSFNREALALARQLDNPDVIAMILNNLGVIACQQGDYLHATALLDEALAIWRNLKATPRVRLVRFHLGEVARAQGEYTRAADNYRMSLRFSVDEHDDRRGATCLLELMIVAQACGQAELAARLLGAADGLRDWRASRLRADELAEYDAAIAASRAALGAARFAAARAAGRGLTLAQAAAVAEAVAIDAPVSDPREPAGPIPFGLTARELDVLRLLAQRDTDREIAGQLFISPRTVSRHITNIFTKLGVGSRREAEVLVARHGLASARQP